VLAVAIDGRPWPEETRSTVRLAAIAGVVAGLAVLARPAMLFFLALAGLLLLAKRRGATLAVLAAGALLVVTPWTVRNAYEYHRFVLVASEGGITFWTGNHPLSPGEGDMAANPAIKIESRRLRARHPGLTEEQMESVYYQDALAAIRRDPAWWAGLLGRKLFYAFVPAGPSYTLHSRLYQVSSVLSYAIVLPFGLVGLVHAWRNGRTPRALLLLAASAVLVCVVFLPQERFRIPVIDPTLLVGAAACLELARARAAAATADAR